MNTVQLTGRLVRDPELKQTGDGKAICSMRLAVDGMGRQRQAGFLDVTTFGPAGEACARTLSAGWLVAVSGRLDYREWRQDGAPRSAIGVVGHVEFLAVPRGRNGDRRPDRATSNSEDLAAA